MIFRPYGPWIQARYGYMTDIDGKVYLYEIEADMTNAGREFQVAVGEAASEVVISTILVSETNHPSFRFPIPIEIPSNTTRISMRRI